jgi:hypothetical protein
MDGWMDGYGYGYGYGYDSMDTDTDTWMDGWMDGLILLIMEWNDRKRMDGKMDKNGRMGLIGKEERCRGKEERCRFWAVYLLTVCTVLIMVRLLTCVS